MNVKNVSDLPRANDIKTNENILMDAPQDGHIYVRQDGEWVLVKRDSCNSQIKTIDLTKTSKRISIWDYMERDEIQTFSDMMLDYLNTVKITDYKTDKYYAEYVPDLVDIKIVINSDEVMHYQTWADIFSVRGFFEEKIRTAHIIDKETNAIVAKINYIGGDDNAYDDKHKFSNYLSRIASKIIPVEPTNIDYYLNMLNYALKNGVTLIKEGVESVVVESVEPKILNLMGYPLDSKKMHFSFYEEYKGDSYYQVDFTCAVDFPTGCIPVIFFECYGSDEWANQPDSIR